MQQSHLETVDLYQAFFGWLPEAAAETKKGQAHGGEGDSISSQKAPQPGP